MLIIAMDICNNKHKDFFARKPQLLDNLMEICEKLYSNQMEQKDSSYAHTLMRKFTSDEEMLSTISVLANEYEQVRGDSINTYLAISLSWHVKEKKESS
jgi:hypothetical protein